VFGWLESIAKAIGEGRTVVLCVVAVGIWWVRDSVRTHQQIRRSNTIDGDVILKTMQAESEAARGKYKRTLR
jgi:hypothetical protein